ncbi:MAG: hypothetical protein EPN93_05055 [Spirochaetes bacterium]|nr:MAG: hypothetical protein EPN93_05055 [Spirochaetota bacterium]
MSDTPAPGTQGKTTPDFRKSELKKSNSSSRLLYLIMQYRESRFYRWISTHPEVSIAIVGLWGMSIIIMFLWFVVTRVVQAQ